MTVELRSFPGSVPLGFLAALGLLAAAEHVRPDRRITLHWTDGIVAHPVIGGVESVEELVDIVEEDRVSWADSLILHSGPDGEPMDEIKPLPDELHRWARRILGELDGKDRRSRRDADQMCSLLAEGAVAGKGDAKPTHLHFAAGQQKFVVAVRDLAERVDRGGIAATLAEPWRFEWDCKGLNWDPRGERIYALTGFSPSSSTGKRGNEAPAEWLGFLSLAFIPVARNASPYGDPLASTACSGRWMSGTFSWPLWSVPLTASVVRSVMTAGFAEADQSTRRRSGVFRVIAAPVRRNDQGYGSFGPASEAKIPDPNADTTR